MQASAGMATPASTGEDIIEYEYGLRVPAIDLVQNRRLGFAASYNRLDLTISSLKFFFKNARTWFIGHIFCIAVRLRLNGDRRLDDGGFICR